jgi:imidazoleglycerol-phosphate dehydratase
MVGLVGSALGKELNKIVHADSNPRSSRFCCPLDEALVECILTKHSNGAAEGKLTAFTLPPYGKYPASTGRTKIGHLLTSTVETFFQSLAKQSGLDISLIKIRGDNGHHVVESAFKAFSRALRNLIDGTDTNNYSSVEFKKMWGESSDSYRDGLELGREGKVERCTKETSILVRAYLDGLKNGHGVDVNTGIQTMDDFVSILAKEACISMEVKCKGDLYVDDHHTSEDVSIAIGQVINSALGTKAGLNRMWCAVGTYGGEFISFVIIHTVMQLNLGVIVFPSSQLADAEVEVTMDLSNRPCITHNLSLSSNPNNEEYAGDLSIEMLDHVLDSLVINSKFTVHFVEKKVGKDVKETALAAACAYGRALRMCVAVDPRRAGKTASSKGTLSV